MSNNECRRMKEGAPPHPSPLPQRGRGDRDARWRGAFGGPILNSMGTRLQVIRWALMVLAVLAPAVAQAQSTDQVLQRAPPVWLGYLVMFVLLVVVLAVSLMPSKRGHQD